MLFTNGTDGTTVPQVNYVKFMSYLIGTSVLRFANENKANRELWNEQMNGAREELRPGSDGKTMDGRLIRTFVLRNGAEATWHDVSFVKYLSDFMKRMRSTNRATNRANVEWIARKGTLKPGGYNTTPAGDASETARSA